MSNMTKKEQQRNRTPYGDSVLVYQLTRADKRNQTIQYDASAHQKKTVVTQRSRSSFFIGSAWVAPLLFLGLRQLFGVLAYCIFNQWREVFLEVRGHPKKSDSNNEIKQWNALVQRHGRTHLLERSFSCRLKISTSSFLLSFFKSNFSAIRKWLQLKQSCWIRRLQLEGNIVTTDMIYDHDNRRKPWMPAAIVM